MDQINKVILSVGSNLGNRENNIKNAEEELNKRTGSVIACSPFYYSDPVGFLSDHQFCNVCMKLLTNFDPFVLLDEIQKIESNLGRSASEKGLCKDRTIDIDIIFFNELEVKSQTLTIPHPKWELRPFVTIPLTQLM